MVVGRLLRVNVRRGLVLEWNIAKILKSVVLFREKGCVLFCLLGFVFMYGLKIKFKNCNGA